MSAEPRVSVVLTEHNGRPFVGETIESILRQSFSDFELLIVDDSSTDGSREILERYAAADPRIRIVDGPGQGRGPAMNLGVAQARGAFVAQIDHDDLAMPERLATQVAWIEKTGVDAGGSHAEMFGLRTGAIWFPERHRGIANEMHLRAAVLQGAMIARTALLRENPYIEGAAFDDYELLTRLALRCRLGNVPEVLLRYRIHDGQAHRRRHAEHAADMGRYRHRYCYAQRPDLPLADYVALCRISDRQAARSVPELDRAGNWLERLADADDPALRAVMVGRWDQIYRQSAGLGPDADALWRNRRPRIARRNSTLAAESPSQVDV